MIAAPLLGRRLVADERFIDARDQGGSPCAAQAWTPDDLRAFTAVLAEPARARASVRLYRTFLAREVARSPARTAARADADHDRRPATRPSPPCCSTAPQRRRRRPRRRDRARLRAFRPRGAPGARRRARASPVRASLIGNLAKASYIRPSGCSTAAVRRPTTRAWRTGRRERRSMTASAPRLPPLLPGRDRDPAGRGAGRRDLPRSRCLPPMRCRARRTPSPSPAGASTLRRPGHRHLGAHGRRASTRARTWMSYDIHNPATYSPVLHHLQPGRRLGLAQALHGHRARARPPRRPRPRQRPPRRDVALLRLPDARVRRRAPAPSRPRGGPRARVTTAEAPGVRARRTRKWQGRPRRRRPSARSPSARATTRGARQRQGPHAPQRRRPRQEVERPRGPAAVAAAFAPPRPAGPSSRPSRRSPCVGAHWASARSPSGSSSGVGTCGVSRRYHSASSAAWQPEPAAVTAWR